MEKWICWQRRHTLVLQHVILEAVHYTHWSTCPGRNDKHMPNLEQIWKQSKWWLTQWYLIIDECSMISRAFLSKLSTILGLIMTEAKGEWQEEAFGGMNVILCGDFHQFPSIRGGPRATLYWPSVAGDSSEEALRLALYRKFNGIVILKDKMQG